LAHRPLALKRTHRLCLPGRLLGGEFIRGLGTSKRFARESGRRRLSPDRQVEFRQRLPAGPLDGRARTAMCSKRTARSGSTASAGPRVRTLLFPASEATLLDTWRTIGLCGTASDSYCVNDAFVSEAFSTTREDPTLRRERSPLYAFTMQCLYLTAAAFFSLRLVA
jgi:hypothetical protein